MTTITCGGCGVEYAIPDSLYRDLKATSRVFTCPNGCRRHFIPEPTPEQREIAQLRRRLEDAWETSQSWRETAEDVYRELRRCPLCGESTSRARSFETIRSRLVEHLRAEHGARARMRAIEQQTGAGAS